MSGSVGVSVWPIDSDLRGVRERVANLANRFSTLGIPEPKAIFLDDPHDGGFGGGGEPGLDDTLSGIPATVKPQCHVGANGVISEAGKENDSCNALFPKIGHVTDKDLVLSYTDTHGNPDLLSAIATVAGPQELLARLAALIPPPRAHQTRYNTESSRGTRRDLGGPPAGGRPAAGPWFP